MSFNFGDSVSEAAFEQILEMDDSPSNRDFSKTLVYDYFDQAKETFQGMDAAVEDLAKLSDLGHFLKGSSAALGFDKVKDHCQVIQQYGKKMTLDGTPEPDKSVCLARITEAITAAKANMTIVEDKMNEFFGV
ncbi:osomolarity two-component system, phosphorelay intermediate protein YPD1 [Sporothrix brasiliensis 5110]|uniref:Osomolarity two-component system, phosphorelay intermediate protein YPD1 n=1 Tax=Sporothrix brasiliensis 5110 TaxID=1398154 RepID=A0A0C2F875_9PEZI|nr:osomolarity two-component system, phosphorelay intermediate protein YPD1 [Sporothrix brasiliensis 5110]KIH95254.1 osomolarity two-component system, phosphorelay intermediate protein YPD1 [Sporothrix brasiliensis 5110]